jgi:hypothetical protein
LPHRYDRFAAPLLPPLYRTGGTALPHRWHRLAARYDRFAAPVARHRWHIGVAM